MSKITHIVILISATISSVHGQINGNSFRYSQDALLFSRTYQGGTARMQAIGGAQTSLGGDINAAFANPAGLGFLRSGVITLTPALDINNTDSDYQGSHMNDFNGNFNFSNLGISFSKNNDDADSKIKGRSFAITLTRKNNFHNKTRYEGQSAGSSIIDSWLSTANGANGTSPLAIESLPDMEYFALQQGLIVDYYDTNDNLTDYDSWIPGAPIQYEEVERTGAQYEWNFAGGVNYNDKLYFGGGLAISTINYFSQVIYEEYNFLSNEEINGDISFLSTQTTTNTDGLGVGANLGVIVRPVDYFRLGLSINTPTYYGINEKISRDLLTGYNVAFVDLPDGSQLGLEDEFYDNLEPLFSRYTLTTPWKLSAGGSFFLGKLGFISADIDYIDYASTQIRSTDFDGYANTQEVKNLYTAALNYRIGSEIRLEKIRLRAGYSYDGDPIEEGDIDYSIKRITAGIGYRNDTFFMDLAIIHSITHTGRQSYTEGPVIPIESNNTNASVTFGVNF